MVSEDTVGASQSMNRGRWTVAAVAVALVVVALVMAAVETFGGSTTTGVHAGSEAGALVAHSAGGTAAVVGTTTSARNPAAPPVPGAHPGGSPPGRDPSTLLHPTSPSAHHGSGLNTPAAVADPHKLVNPAAHGFDPATLSPDSTPLAAAAGTEPSSMAPLTGVPAGWVSSVHRFSIDSMTRSYLLLRPKARSLTPLPVVVVLHGRQLTPAGIERLSQMPSTTGPSIQVYPAGYGRSWDAGGCCGVAHSAHIDDVAFLTATVKQVLASQHDAAANRVYVIGYSNGGRMAYRLACAAPGMWAGVAAVEAVPVDSCATTTAVPIMVVASSHDPLLTIDDGQRRKVMQGYLQPTVETTVDQWRQLDGCAPSGTVSVTGVATVSAWDRCRGAGRVAYALYQGGSHTWPAGREGASGTPSAEDLVWAWLQHSTVITAAAA